jgi:MSHA biogenesis protein MshE
MARPEKIRLGELLVQQKLISQEQLSFALNEQKRSGRKLGRILVDNAFISDDQLAEMLGKQLGLPYVNLKFFNLRNEIVQRLPENQARRHRALPLEDRNGVLLVGMGDPTDLFAFDEIKRVLKCEIEVAVVTEGRLLDTLDRLYRRTAEISGIARELSEELGDHYVDFNTVGDNASVEEAPVVRLLQTVFNDAIQIRASDIHIEPQEKRLQIRFRIDGQLHLQTETDSKVGPALILRLKLMSGLDISEKRLPQDGRFNIKVRDQAIDVRLATMPTQYGESVVMRLLNQGGNFLTLENLGMPPEMLERFRDVIRRSSGMVLVTGPTGSGKTTTLYAGLAEINTVEQKIITVEDPVEYRLPGINQVQINTRIDLTFARVLRTVLRQDPDVILVGEMRDEETVHIGLRAVMTGHLVFSTLHTRDAASTIARMMDMGAPKYMVAATVQIVLAQRLLRKVCESCSAPHTPTAQEMEWLKHVSDDAARWNGLLHGKGCPHCSNTGYRGRVGVYEMLEMTPDLVDAAAHQEANQFTVLARESLAGKTMLDHALERLRAGQTTVQEVIRISNQLED